MHWQSQHKAYEATMIESNEYQFNLRQWQLTQDATGHTYWQEITAQRRVSANKTAIVICDMWDKHWSRGASERVDAMAPTMNQVLSAARKRGVHIIHAPSDT